MWQAPPYLAVRNFTPGDLERIFMAAQRKEAQMEGPIVVIVFLTVVVLGSRCLKGKP
jgi:hypothetical protein